MLRGGRLCAPAVAERPVEGLPSIKVCKQVMRVLLCRRTPPEGDPWTAPSGRRQGDKTAGLYKLGKEPNKESDPGVQDPALKRSDAAHLVLDLESHIAAAAHPGIGAHCQSKQGVHHVAALCSDARLQVVQWW